MSYLINAKRAMEILENNDHIRFIDCRFDLADPIWGEKEYHREHISGAVYADLEKDLSGPAGKHGGRHPMPDLKKFKALIEKFGIEKDTAIIAYDQGGAPYAARFWWLMKYIGHQRIYVLNGGFTAWKKSGFPVNQSIPVYRKSSYSFEIQEEIFADINDVKKAVYGNSDVLLIDSREYARYTGSFEPIDKVKGRIPGAINKFWLDGVEDGKFAPEEKQLERFSDVPKDREIIVYCGSGVTAAPNVLLLNSIGYKNVKLYLGSFSDWISYEDQPVEKDSGRGEQT